MGNGASSTQYKLSNSKHVHRNSKDYQSAMAKVRSSVTDSGKQTRDGYKYVTGDTLEEAPVECSDLMAIGGRAGRGDHAVLITDGETLLFSDANNPYVVAAGGEDRAARRRKKNDAERLIHVDIDGANRGLERDKGFMVGVME